MTETDSRIQSIPKLNYIFEAHLTNIVPLAFHANAYKGEQAIPIEICLEMTNAFSPYMRSNTFIYLHTEFYYEFIIIVQI